MTDSPPIPARPALFLDFDGTLVGFAETPDAVDVPGKLQPLLEALRARCGGAVAFVTGRSISGLEALLKQAPQHAVGVHGAEWRTDGTDIEVVDGNGFDEERAMLRTFADDHTAIVMEEKSAGLTLHYRRDPGLREAAHRTMQSSFTGRDDFEILPGHMMVEARRRGVHKGGGIERLMQSPVFADRVPVFLGDDVTDEDGFRTVNDLGGVAIKVGEGETAARHRLTDIPAVYSYLERMAASA